jgi:phospholipid-binding lipoprotein MlaA
MKSLSIVVVFAILQVLAVAAGSPDNQTAPSHPSVNGTAADTDQEFRDPFARSETVEKPRKVSDPLEPMNRAFFKFNDKLYFWVLKPVSKGYNKVAPEPFRQSMRNAFVNVRYPVRVMNNLLQAKFKGAGIETARFLINSTVGIGGLFDPARDEWHLKPYPQELDLTLGFYGLPPGPYINWPVLGPSSVRGSIGIAGDSFLSPWTYLDGAAVFLAPRAYDILNSTSLQLGEYESFKNASFDPYLSLRDAYLEHRSSLILQPWRESTRPSYRPDSD